MANKDRARAKALELTVGRLYGGRRRHNGEGIEYDDCVREDGSRLPVSIEAKAHAVLQLRTAWIDQAKRNATGGRPWVLVQRPKGSHTIYATVDHDYLLHLILFHESHQEAHRDTTGDESPQQGTHPGGPA